MGIGKRIKEARNALGITQKELAVIVGVTKSAISNYESESNSPKDSVIYKIMKALNVDANFLFQDEMEESVCVKPLSPAAQRVGRLYDKASDKDKATVELVLAEYDDDKKGTPEAKVDEHGKKVAAG